MNQTAGMKSIFCRIKTTYVFTILLVFAFILLLSTDFLAENSRAATNDSLSFQGKIVRNDAGSEGLNVSATETTCIASPGADTCGFEVVYYDDPTAGNTLGSETFTNVEIGDYDGVFNLALGKGTWSSGTESTWLDVFYNNDTVYAEVSFDKDGTPYTYGETFARMAVRAAPYAIRSKNADALDGIDSTGFVQLAPGATAQDDSSTTSSIFIDKTGASGNILQLQKDGTDVLVLDNTGELGIGTTTPTANLHIGQLDSANNVALLIDTEESTSSQDIFKIISDVGGNETTVFNVDADGTITVGGASLQISGVDNTIGLTSDTDLLSISADNLDVKGSQSVQKSLTVGEGTAFSGWGFGQKTASVQNAGTYAAYMLDNGDFDNDGDIDFVLNHWDLAYIQVYLNDGDGTFTGPTNYNLTAGGASRGVAVGDVDNDGYIDIVASDTDNDLMAVFINDGDGTFAAKVDYTPGTTPRSVKLGDVDRDGYLDMVVANDGDADVSVLINDGDGTFATKVDYPTGTNSRWIALADYDGDSYLDIAAANSGADTVSILINLGDGTYTTKVDYAMGDYPRSVAAADFDQDGYPDITTSDLDDDTVSVRINDGDGTFGAQVTYGVGDAPWQVETGDFNGDGYPDLASMDTTESSTNPYGMTIYINDRDGTLTKETRLETHTPTALDTGDFDKDGYDDIIYTRVDSTSIVFSSGKDHFKYKGVEKYYLSHAVTDAELGDFNNDGYLDVATSKQGSPAMSISLNKGDGTYAAATSYATAATGGIAVGVGDVNNDNYPDVAVGHNPGTSVSMFINNGDGTFATKVDYSTGGRHYEDGIAFEDVDNDGYMDMIVHNWSDNNDVSVLINNGDGTFIAAVDYATVSFSQGLNLADVNRDGYIDILTDSTSAASVLLNDGDGTFAAKVDYSYTSDNFTRMDVGDLNGDQYADLVIGDYSGNDIEVFLNDGDGTYTAFGSYDSSVRPDPTLGDVNNDGFLDVVTQNEDSDDISVMLGVGDGSFEPPVNFYLGSVFGDLELADVNNDGKLDVINAGNWTYSFAVIMNGALSNKISGDLLVTNDTWLQGGLHVEAVVEESTSGVLSLIQSSKAYQDFLGSGDGTYLGVNADSNFLGNLLDLQVEGSSVFNVDYQGNLSLDGDYSPVTTESSNIGSGSQANMITMDQDLGASDASFLGEVAYDYSGRSVSSAGDVNGDGFDDILIGALENDEGGIGEEGQTYLILGKSSSWAMDTELSASDASFLGEVDGDYSGHSVSSAGDVNGDGYDDILIGAYGNDESGTNGTGQTYLIFGAASGWAMDTELSASDASFIGEEDTDQSGRSVSGVGDVNGDGYDDILIGAPGNAEGGSNAEGQTYLILGKASGWSMDTDLSTSDASFLGEVATDNSGEFVSGAGDVNGDGYDDFLVGAYFNDEGGSDNEGQTYLILGKASGWAMDTELSASDASFLGEAIDDRSGLSLSGVGDVNGDGYDDILIGALRNNDGGSNDEGQTYLILGKASGWAMDTELSASDASFLGEAIDDFSGSSVSGAGDVNGDGYDDMLVSATGNDEGGSDNEGQTYLILGKPTGWSMDSELSASDASFLGEAIDDGSGGFVSGAGDVNGDGYDDILIGAPYNNEGGSADEGQAYLILSDPLQWDNVYARNVKAGDSLNVGDSIRIEDETIKALSPLYLDATRVNVTGGLTTLGNLGIGTTTPDELLVVGTGSTEDTLKLNGSGTATSGTTGYNSSILNFEASGYDDEWDTNIVDSALGPGEYQFSMTLDSNDYPVITYSDGYLSVAGGSNLKFVHCNDTKCAGGDDVPTIIDSTSGTKRGYESVVRLDSNGYPTIMYFEEDVGSMGINILHCNDVNCSGGDETMNTVVTGTGFDEYSGDMVLDTNDYPVIAYQAPIGSSGQLEIVHCNDVNCSGGDETTSVLDSSTYTAYFLSMVLDDNGYPVVLYFDSSSWGDLILVHCNDVNCAGGNESIETVATDAASSSWDLLQYSLALDSNGYPAFTYQEDGDGLNFVHCNDVNCAGSNETINTLDSSFAATVSLKLNSSNDYPVIAYGDWSPTTNVYKVIECNDVDCSGSDETITTFNTYNTGYNVNLSLDSSNKPIIAYDQGDGEQLRVTKAPSLITSVVGYKIQNIVNDSLNNRLSILNPDDSEALSVTSKGYVGIGTTTPNNLLEVEGLISFDPDRINTFIGQNSGLNSTSQQSTGLGANTLSSNTGSRNTAIGDSAMKNNIYGGTNVVVGGLAMSGGTTGSNNAVVGYSANRAGSGNYNSYLGSYSGGVSGTGSGSKNVAIGYRSGTSMQSSAGNNIFVGYQAGDNVSTGSNNLIIGYDLNAPSPTASNQMYLGGVIYGDLSTGDIGLGTTSPTAKLDAVGTGTAKSNYNMLALTNDANAADMDGTETSILFNQYYYDATTPAIADTARITAGTVGDWTSDAATQDSYLDFYTVSEGNLSLGMRLDSDGNLISIGSSNIGSGSVGNMTTMDQSLSNADASFWGEDASDFSGNSISSAGDVNGDGFDDFIIGAHGDDDGGSSAGQTYLILGKESGFSMDTDLSSVDASYIGEIFGSSAQSISGGGDLNGDGFDDFVIGAYVDTDTGGLAAGQTYVVFGKESGWSMDNDLSVGDASFIGEDADDESGTSVDITGDVNGDGYDDLIIGAADDEEGGNNAGQTYVVFGKASGWSMDADLSTADASFLGEDADDLSGSAVSAGGDVNGDGYDDILIAAYGDEDGGGAYAGQVYLILGGASGWSMDTDLSTADASFWGEASGYRAGLSASIISDVNGDGYDDILIGSNYFGTAGSSIGKSYLIFGKSSGWSMDADLSTADASFLGEATNDSAGQSVSGAGDVNGDGFGDILIAAPGNDDGAASAGQMYIILGKSSGWSTDINLSASDASFLGEDSGDTVGNSYLGTGIAGAGDVNGDGFDDIIMGARGDEDGGANAGQTYLILSDPLQWDNVYARNIKAGDSLNVGDSLRFYGETIKALSPLNLDATRVNVTGGLSTVGDLTVGGALGISGDVTTSGSFIANGVKISDNFSIGNSTKLGSWGFGNPVGLYRASDQEEVEDVAVGDVNNDGYPDLVATNAATSNIAVFLNDGDGTYGEKSEYPTGTNPNGVKIGDFNNDNFADIAVANYSSSTVSVYINEGDGTFQPKVDYGTGASALEVDIGDFDNDGYNDIVATNRNGTSVSVLINIGDGTFAAKADYTTGAIPRGVRVADFDGDGYLDLAVSNYTPNTVSILINDKDGTFATKVDYAVGTNPQAITVGDFNRDGYPDIACVNDGTDNLSILINDTDGTFATKVDYDTKTFPFDVETADFDQDGDLDLVVQDGSSVASYGIFMNNGDGTFATKIDYDTQRSSYSVDVGDVNNDGYVDIIPASYEMGYLIVHLNNLDGTFNNNETKYTTTGDPNHISSGDYNNDGYVDIVTAHRGGSDKIAVSLNNGDGTLASAVDYSTGDNPTSIATDDFDNDGYMDIATSNSGGAGSVSVLINDRDGTFATKADYAANAITMDIGTGDFNKDGYVDIAAVNQNATNVSIFINDGDGTFAAKVDYTTGTEPLNLTVGDFNSDGYDDLGITNQTSDTLSVLINYGDGTFVTKVDYPANEHPQGIDSGDIDHDGDIDIVVGNYGTFDDSDFVSVYLNNGDGTYEAKVDYPAGPEPDSLHLVDVDKDGNLDLVAESYNSHTALLLLNFGDGTYGDPLFYIIGPSALDLTVTDLNKDGYVDLATSLNTDEISIIFNGTRGSVIQGDLEVIGNTRLRNDLSIGGGLGIGNTTATNAFSVGSVGTVESFNDGFEDGTLTPFTTSGDANWTVQSGTKYAGTYAAQGGDIDDSEKSVLEYSDTLTNASEITFYISTSSEGNFDFLTFYIDDIRQESWSGTTAWEQYRTYVSAGAHVFKWVIDKDSNGSSGSDTAWIDDVVIYDQISDSYFAGAVGIGTETPQYSLDVAGIINTRNSYLIGGMNALSMTGDNLFIGDRAGENSGGYGSVLIGNEAGMTGQGIWGTTITGMQAGRNVTTGISNNLYGYRAAQNVSTGSDNVAFGTQALQNVGTGNRNVAVGNYALNTIDPTQDSGSITAFADGGGGQVTVTSASHGLSNGESVEITGTTNYNGTFVIANVATDTFEITDTWVSDDATGSWVAVSQGGYNVALGYESGYSSTSGSRNVFLGYQAGYSETGSDRLYIENSNSATPLIGGDFADDEVYINGKLGIGTETPTALGISYVGATQTALTSSTEVSDINFDLARDNQFTGSADTLVIQPNAAAGVDTYVDPNNRDTTYATTNFMHLRSLFGGLVKFDLSSLPAGAVITSATLTVVQSNGTRTLTGTLNAYPITAANSSWDESSTYNYRVPTTETWAGSAGARTAGTDYGTSSGSVSWPSGTTVGDSLVITLNTSDVETMRTANYGFILRETSAGNDWPQVATSDHSTSSWRPKLTINYTIPLDNQRAIQISAPTYSFSAADTINNTSTLSISGAPVQGTNATIENTYGLRIAGGAVSTATNAYGLFVDAPTGASNNYAAVFNTGNVGIGKTDPGYLLDVAGDTNLDGGALYFSGTSPTVADADSIAIYKSGTAMLVQADGNIVIRSDEDEDGGGEIILRTNKVARLTAENDGDININAGDVFIDRGEETLEISALGTAKGNDDLLLLTNRREAADMDGTETSILFGQYYLSASSPTDAGRISVGTEQDWTSTGTTQDSYLSFSNALDGTVSEVARFTSAGELGINDTTPSYLLDVNGTIRGYGITDSSDLSLKESITDIDHPLDKIMQLRGVNYYWKDKDSYGSEPQMGFIAQELESTLPELVSTADDGLKSIAYGKLTALLAEGVQEQQLMIGNLGAELDEININLGNRALSYDVDGNLELQGGIIADGRDILDELDQIQSNPVLSNPSMVQLLADYESGLLGGANPSGDLAVTGDLQLDGSMIIGDGTGILELQGGLNVDEIVSQSIISTTITVASLGAGTINTTNLISDVGNIADLTAESAMFATLDVNSGALVVGEDGIKIVSDVILDGILSSTLDVLEIATKIKGTDGRLEVEGTLAVETLESEQLTTKQVSVDRTDVAGASAGIGIVLAGEQFVLIDTTAVDIDSLVFVTAKTTSAGEIVPMAVGETIEGQFKVEIDQVYTEDIEFNWWIVQ